MAKTSRKPATRGSSKSKVSRTSSGAKASSRGTRTSSEPKAQLMNKAFSSFEQRIDRVLSQLSTETAQQSDRFTKQISTIQANVQKSKERKAATWQKWQAVQSQSRRAGSSTSRTTASQAKAQWEKASKEAEAWANELVSAKQQYACAKFVATKCASMQRSMQSEISKWQREWNQKVGQKGGSRSARATTGSRSGFSATARDAKGWNQEWTPGRMQASATARTGSRKAKGRAATGAGHSWGNGSEIGRGAFASLGELETVE